MKTIKQKTRLYTDKKNKYISRYLHLKTDKYTFTVERLNM